jgi:hypothetical protein
MQMPGVQNRTYDYHQGIATDSFPGRVLSETTTGLTNNSGTALLALAGKGMPGGEQKVKKTAHF